MNRLEILNKQILKYLLSKSIGKSNTISKEYLDHLLLNLSTKLQAELKEEIIIDMSKKINVPYDSSCLIISKYYVKVLHILSILLDVLGILDINDTSNIQINKIGSQMLKELSFSNSQSLLPDLDSFYNNDYLHDNKFYHMSKSNRKRYNKDLKSFYISFSGKKDLPEHITKFQDVMIKDYSEESNVCIDNYLFYEYAFYLKNKIKIILEIQKELYIILYKIYSIKNNSIQADLTDKKLNEYIHETRRLVIKLLNECDEVDICQYDVITFAKTIKQKS